MVLGCYRFRGDPDALLAAHRRMLRTFPPEALDLHVCVRTDDGIAVLDACPSLAVLRSFSTSAELLDACRDAGLPAPELTVLGEVEQVVASAAALAVA